MINTNRRGGARVSAAMLGVVGAAAFVVAWELTGRAGTFGRTWVPRRFA